MITSRIIIAAIISAVPYAVGWGLVFWAVFSIGPILTMVESGPPYGPMDMRNAVIECSDLTPQMYPRWLEAWGSDEIVGHQCVPQGPRR